MDNDFDYLIDEDERAIEFVTLEEAGLEIMDYDTMGGVCLAYYQGEGSN